MSGFDGFQKATLAFLTGLGNNNSKVWFDTHRADYEADYLEPAKAFVDAVAKPLQAIAPAVNAEPRVNGSIFRINRDIRFSKDKTPYKDHLDLWFWEGTRKGAVSGFFFRLTATHLITGAGAHGFDKDRLAQYRERLADGAEAKNLATIVDAIADTGFEVGGAHYKKPPRGVTPANAEAARLLLHNALWASCEEPHPASLGTPAIVDHSIGRWKAFAPLHRWLADRLH